MTRLRARDRDEGAGPGEQTGRCLFGIRGETVLMLKDGVWDDGVGACRIGGGRMITVAIVTFSRDRLNRPSSFSDYWTKAIQTSKALLSIRRNLREKQTLVQAQPRNRNFMYVGAGVGHGRSGNE